MENEQNLPFLEGTYLISANSERGFMGYFDQAFSPSQFDKLYIIHGGSGTGKSSAMKKICRSALENGAISQEIRCSSDIDSLDGVILRQNGKTVGIVDGTAPHARIASFPGVCDEEWDFAHFLSEVELKKEKDRILSLCERKKGAYQRAYTLLGPAGSCHREAERSRLSHFDKEKARASYRKILKHASRASAKREKGLEIQRLIRSFSMKGERTLSSWAPKGVEIFYLRSDTYSAECYLCGFLEEARSLGLFRVSLVSPLCTDLLDGVYLPSLGLAVTKEPKGRETPSERCLYLSRFFDEKLEASDRSLIKIEEGLIKKALSSLEDAARAHFELERIYSAAMDFQGLASSIQEKTEEVLRILKD